MPWKLIEILSLVSIELEYALVSQLNSESPESMSLSFEVVRWYQLSSDIRLHPV